MVVRENQTGLIRNSNDTGAGFNELASEDFLVAYRIERQRIREAREAELKAEKKENEPRRFPESLQEQIKDLLGDAIEDKIRDRLPKPVDALITVIEEAQSNQLKVQDAIAPQIKIDDCGVSIESLFINYTSINENCRQQEGTSTEPKPFETPAGTPFFNNNAGVYRALFNPDNVGKTLTLLWKYEGWVSDVFITSSSSSGVVQWSGLTDIQANSLIGANIINIIRFIPSNPISGSQSIGINSQGNSLPWRYYSDSRVSAGSFADVVYPQQFPYNINYIGTHARYGYRSTAKVLAVQKFNTSNGIRRFYNLRINMRTDISIGTGGFPQYGSFSSDQPPIFTPYNAVTQDFHLMQFFRMAYSHIPNDEFPVGVAQLTDPLILGSPTIPGFKKPLPPPPPPRSKCDCMANCCPQNQYDLAEVKRLLRAISAKQREQDRKIGLDKLPLEVPGSNAVYQKLGKMAADNPVTNFFFNNWLTQQVLSVAGIFPNVKLNSLLEAISFLSSEGGGGGDSSDLAEVVGQPIEVSLWDTDFTKQGSQVEKRKPKNLFQHLALLTDRVEVALKIIGIHDLPIVVDKSRSKYDNLAKVFIASPSTAMVEMGKNLLKVDRKQITSVFQLLNWVGDTVDEKLGHWESEVSFKDVDLLKHNNQEMSLVHGNMQHALHDITKFSGNAGIHAEANTWLLSDVLMEMAVLKKTIIEQTYTLQALVDYLGFDHGEEAVDIPIPVTFDQKLLEEKNLPKFLEDSTTPGLKITLKDKEKSLSQRLTEIENTLGILRAVNLFPVKGVADIKALLELLNNEKRWDAYIKSANKFSEENELQLEIKKNDDPTE